MRLLYIRLRQTQRILKELKLYILFFVLLFSLFVTISISLYTDPTTSIYQLIFLLLLCLSIHLTRKDKAFIRMHIDNSRLEVFSEYFVLTFPFSFGVLISNQWYYFFVFQVLLSSVTLIPINISGERFKLRSITRLIRPLEFEYISGFRRTFYYAIPLYAGALVFSWFRIFPLVFLWLITIAATSFYFECEPLIILRERCKSPKRFLWLAVLSHSKYLFILYSPVLVVNAVFNEGFWLINILFLIIQVSLLMLALTLKYSSYIPNENLDRNKVILSISSLGAIVPYFLPVPLVASIYYFNKAVRNLTRYL